MTNILITGAKGFIGRNLVTWLEKRDNIALFKFDLGNTEEELREWVAKSDVIFHLAGVNRPETLEEFETGNAGFTKSLVESIHNSGHRPHIIVSSSIQAILNNPYGRSKRHSEQILEECAKETRSRVSIFRLKNVFGKWCRPNYNSFTATVCHNIAHDLPIKISDPNHKLDLVYIDDVVERFLFEMDSKLQRESCLVEPDPIPFYTLTLRDLVGRVQFFREMQTTLQIPDFSERFNQHLYATYLSYVPPDRWEYGPEIHSDDRGTLAELVKSPCFGQIFVSRTRPGITRGNHYHHTKTEKFIVIAGKGLIRFRHIDQTEVLEFPVNGEDYRIVEIPPGFTHSITNIGETEMITLFWASVLFDPDRMDTYYSPVVVK